ncbi:MAG: hypothetical protein EA361_10595 [Bacteroidetes bacterium]|nr:MAG: hypothetical protein EA361_10595 [Bacteroidota bacterium]
MEDLPLILEGIDNKIKKLIFSNRKLKEENQKITDQKQNLEQKVEQLNSRNAELEDSINKLKIAKVMTGEDTFRARQQINELLREIDKCYSLLNR